MLQRLRNALRPAWTALTRRMFGFDAFISYTHRDATGYATSLEHALERAGLTCFRDTQQLEAGDRLDPTIARALKRSRMLVALGTPRARESDYMAHEIASFDTRRPLIGIDFGNSLPHDRWSAMQGRIFVVETLEALAAAQPSTACVQRVAGARRSWKVRSLQRIVTLAIAAVLLALGGAWWVARIESERQTFGSLAGRAAAESQNWEGERAVLLASQAMIWNDRAGGAAFKEAYESLARAVGSSQFFNEFVTAQPFAGKAIAFSSESLRVLVEDGGRLSVARLRERRLETERDLGVLAQARFVDAGRAVAAIDTTTRQFVLHSLDSGDVRRAPLPGTTSNPANLRWHTSSDGKRFVTWDTTVVLLDIDRPNEPRTLYEAEPEQIVAGISGDGQRTAIARVIGPNLHVEVGDADSTLPARVFEIAMPVDGLVGVDLSPSGRYLIARLAAPEGNAVAFIWDLQSTPPTRPRMAQGVGETFGTVAFTTDERRVALGMDSSFVDDQRRDTGIVTVELQPEYGTGRTKTINFNLSSITALQWSADGEYVIASAGNEVRVWEPFYDGPDTAFTKAWESPDPIAGAGWAERDSMVIAVSTSGRAVRWPMKPIESPIALGDFAETDVTTRFAVAGTPDGQHVAAAGHGGLHIWKITGDKPVSKMLCWCGTLLALSFAPGGDLMFGASDRIVSAYEASEWMETTAPPPGAGLGTSNEPPKGRTLAKDSTATMVVAFADGRRAASAGPEGVTVLSSTGESARVIDTPRVSALAASTSGSELAWSVQMSVRRATQANPDRFQSVDAPAPVTALAFVGDDLYAGLANGAVGLMRTNGAFEPLSGGLAREVTGLAGSRDRTLLAAGDEAGNVRLWSLAGGGTPAQLPEIGRPITGVAFVGDDERIAVSSRDGKDRNARSGELQEGRLWLYPTPRLLLRIARTTVWRNLTAEEWVDAFAGARAREDTFPDIKR